MEYREKMIYPIEPWTITETEFSMETNYRNETTFALSNGYIGTRGTFEESYDFSVDEGLEGNFVNGFYESEHVRYGEWNFGFPTESQSLLNLPNGKTIRIYVNGELFDMRRGKVENYRRTLHMKQGLLTRELTWTSPLGHKIALTFERFVSFLHKNVMAQRVRVKALEKSCEIQLYTCIEGDVENHTRKMNPLVDYGPFGRRIQACMCECNEEGEAYFQGKTQNSGLSIACGIFSTCQESIKKAAESSEYFAQICDTCYLETGQELRYDKFIIYTSSLDMKEEKLHDFVKETGRFCQKTGYEHLRNEQISHMEAFWNYADIKIQGDEAVQQGIRFNLFHVMQAAGRDGQTGMGAKGLSGEGYEGHYFWDTEMYILPFFIYTTPEIAKKLLEYRYHTLPQARNRARILGHRKGALYPWRTINGEEASTYFPLGTAQYHINADIAYAFGLYCQVTGDTEFFQNMALEVLCETARVWADVGCFVSGKGGRYCICAVTGPDEYNAIVDNNFYTNLMARENIRDALQGLEWLKKEGKRSGDCSIYEGFMHRLHITEEEILYWKKIVEYMYFPYDEERRIYPLDDGFMMRKPWDDSAIPPEKRHLLYENYHPLFIYRQRMSKQADAILGMYLHSNLFTDEELKRNYDFYQEVTLHHSSLSTCIFGILACQIGYYEEAYTYFSQSARMDLDDYHNNFYAGIHAANMAGTWQAIVNGFAGLRTNRGRLELKPYLPKKWKGYTFKLRYQGCTIEVSVQEDGTRLKLLEGKKQMLSLNGKTVILEQKGEDFYYEKI